MSAEIQTVRAELAAWSAGKPKAVQRAVANLDAWLEAAERVGLDASDCDGVSVIDCVERAVETLRSAQVSLARGR